MAARKGKLKETLGWVTGDRRVAAKGRVEAAGGDSADEEQVDETEREIRRDEGDIASAADA